MDESNVAYKLVSLYANPQQTMLVEEDGYVVYEIKTTSGTTTIKRHPAKGSSKQDGEPDVVATIDWNRNKETWLTIGEKSSRAKDFLRLPGQSTNKREFTGPYGTEYVWKIAVDHLELRPKGTDTWFGWGSNKADILAAYFMEKGRLLKKTQLATLVLGQEAINMMDTVVVTWIWMALMLQSQKSKGMFASMETQWAISLKERQTCKECF